jgi:outer membrane immunogenic protein
MTRQLSRVVLASILSLLGTNAGAQSAQPLPHFAGSYIGAAIGFASKKVEVDNLTLGTSFSDQENAFTFGGYAGYNWLCVGPFLLGAEADINYIGGTPTALDIEFGPTGLNETTRLKSSIDWFGTLRGRAGYVFQDNFLIYATGGLAYARVNHNFHDNCVGCGNAPVNLGVLAQSDSGMQIGWTAGGGGELAMGTNWLLRGEALFVDLGSDTNSYIVRAPIGTANALAKWTDEFWIGRLGVAYQFDWP